MESDRQLVFKALCVLAEARDQARRGRVAPSLGLRFALAYLFTAARARGASIGRGPYDEFWRNATLREEGREGQFHAAWQGRDQTLNACTNAIARAAGMEIDVETLQALARAVRS